MLSYDAGPTDRPILHETVGANFERTVARYPDAVALVDLAQRLRYTYAELNDEIDAVARGLLARGVGKGDRVGLWAPNCAQWVVAQFAVAKVGAILVNINPAYRLHELSYVLQQSGTSVLICATAFKSSDYAAMVTRVRPQLPELREVIFLDGPDWQQLYVAGESVHSDVLVARQVALSDIDPVNIQYTSGTTGFPKGATLSHRNIVNNGFFVTEGIRLTAGESLCVPVPFYHCFGMVMGTLGCTTHGAAVVIPGPGFDPEATLAAVESEKCAGIYGVPTMFIAMQNHPSFARRDLSSLRTGVMAGSVCPVEVMKRVCDRDEHVRGGYRLRDDRDLAGVLSDPDRRRSGAAHRHHRTRPPACGDQNSRSGRRCHRAAR